VIYVQTLVAAKLVLLGQTSFWHEWEGPETLTVWRSKWKD